MSTRRRIAIGAVAGLVLGAIALGAHHNWLAKWERNVLDWRFLNRPPAPMSGGVVVVGITADCQTDPELGPTPWPRSTYADAVDKLAKVGAAVICFDIYFPERTEAAQHQAEDARFAKAIAEAGNVILPIFRPAAPKKGMRIAEPVRRNAEVLTQAAAAEAHINVTVDEDEQVRRVRLRHGSESIRRLQLGVAAGLRYTGAGEDAADDIPTDRDGNIVINWQPNAAWKMGENLFPFADLYHGRIPDSKLRGKVVLIGQTVPGLPYADRYRGPFGPRFGVLIQGEIADSVIRGDFIRPIRAWPYAVLLLLTNMVLGAVLFRLRPIPIAVVGLGVIVLSVVGTQVAFSGWTLLIDVVPLALSQAFLLCAALVFGFRHRALEAERAEEALQVVNRTHQEAVKLLSFPADDGEGDPLGLDAPLAAALRVPEQTPHRVLSLLADQLGARHGFMRLGEDGKDAKWLTVSRDEDAPAEAQEFAAILVDSVATEGDSVLVPDVSREKHLDGYANHVPSALALRLTLGEETLATVVLCGKAPTKSSPGRAFSSADLPLAFALAPQGSLLLDHARLHRSLYSALRRAVATLASAMNARDEYTSGHSDRVAYYTGFLARAMELPGWCVEAVELGALLHDIGKIAMDENVLRGTQPLTDEEWDMVKLHPGTGHGIFAQMEELSVLLPALRHHHERWDGGGYPDGLAGEEIPLLARIVGVADAFDAMTFRRPYKVAPLNFEEACQEVLDNTGTQFDPELARLFVESADPDIIRRAEAVVATGAGFVAQPRTDALTTETVAQETPAPAK